MLQGIVHVGLTVSDMDASIDFYANILGLHYEGTVLMQGEETDLLFHKKDCKVKLAYLNGGNIGSSPPIELIQFIREDGEKIPSSLTKTGISEVCFGVEDIHVAYEALSAKGVEFLSQPQYFDFTQQGFGKSKAVYFKDPDGIILELLQVIK